MGQISSSFQLPSDPPDSLHYLGNTVYNFILFAGIRLVWRVPPGCVGESIKTCSSHTPPQLKARNSLLVSLYITNIIIIRRLSTVRLILFNVSEEKAGLGGVSSLKDLQNITEFNLSSLYLTHCAWKLKYYHQKVE